ncbi:hypothetical protein SKAU_G00413790 [Synaphobranchus kaupii]|uniref:Uncharacterized protein n=1 Tax=Synaphobranchus kaupii TaxID=118154 RepID=A0A9Q1E701_SYNKA|nr:hypothetical protein SKAU_G00413790 [Synaphobranchus kaupii]
MLLLHEGPMQHRAHHTSVSFSVKNNENHLVTRPWESHSPGLHLQNSTNCLRKGPGAHQRDRPLRQEAQAASQTLLQFPTRLLSTVWGIENE